MARMRAYEISKIEGEPDELESSTVRLLGTPSYVYKELLTNVLEWMRASMRLNEGKALYFESKARGIFNYICETYRLAARDSRYSSLAEIAVFVPRLALKKIKNRINRFEQL